MKMRNLRIVEFIKALRVTLENGVSKRYNVTEKQDVRCTCVTVLPALVTYRGDISMVYENTISPNTVLIQKKYSSSFETLL
jgi:hypothetical protein